jgi:phosphatidylinositol alpha-1,6-mannosyltransferase
MKRDLIFVGGLKLHKGIDIVLDMADKLLPANPDIKLTIVGDGPYRSKVEEYSSKYPNFKYLGKVPNRKLPAILNQHGIFVQPCRDIYKYGLKITSEQFGFSFVEAMACGLAVVSADCGAIPEIVAGKNIICEQGDSAGVIHEVDGLLQNNAKLSSVQASNASLARAKYDISGQGKILSHMFAQKAYR